MTGALENWGPPAPPERVCDRPGCGRAATREVPNVYHAWMAAYCTEHAPAEAIPLGSFAQFEADRSAKQAESLG